jgi:hypothetical protein
LIPLVQLGAAQAVAGPFAHRAAIRTASAIRAWIKTTERIGGSAV